MEFGTQVPFPFGFDVVNCSLSFAVGLRSFGSECLCLSQITVNRELGFVFLLKSYGISIYLYPRPNSLYFVLHIANGVLLVQVFTPHTRIYLPNCSPPTSIYLFRHPISYVIMAPQKTMPSHRRHAPGSSSSRRRCLLGWESVANHFDSIPLEVRNKILHL